jgi:hypothetical protein
VQSNVFFCKMCLLHFVVSLTGVGGLVNKIGSRLLKDFTTAVHIQIVIILIALLIANWIFKLTEPEPPLKLKRSNVLTLKAVGIK